MATYRKTPKGWQAQICRNGIRKSATFKLKGEAQGWAENEEHLIKNGKPKFAVNYLFDDALVKYRNEVAIKHRGRKWEYCRIEAIRRHKIALTPIADITPAMLAEYRDERLTVVKGSSVRRDFSMLSSVFTTAVKEWGWIDVSPLGKVKSPQSSPPRNRRISEAEIATIVAELSTESGQTVAIMFKLALQTAMRLGEICGIREEHFFPPNYVHLPITKNGSARDVPLSPAAAALVEQLIQRKPVSPNSASQLFRQAVRAAGIKNLKFHDSRHEATINLSKKVDVMDLARIGGWRDLKILLGYYAPSASELAAKLA